LLTTLSYTFTGSSSRRAPIATPRPQEINFGPGDVHHPPRHVVIGPTLTNVNDFRTVFLGSEARR